MNKKLLAICCVFTLAACAGLGLYLFQEDKDNPFHDFLFMSHNEYMDLVDPDHHAVVKKSRDFKTHQEAYSYVRDEIEYVPHLPATDPHEIMTQGAASCLGKAVLLCSIFRAMGTETDDVRVVTGIVKTPQGLSEHAWVDMEHNGICYQLDPSALLGSFEFNDFTKSEYVENFVVKENFCFNDEDFGIISQRNRMVKRD